MQSPEFATDLMGRTQSCLVIIIGTMRGGEKAWSSAVKNLVDINNADLAVLASDKSVITDKNSSFFRIAKYVWQHVEYDDWADAVDLIDGPYWKKNILPFFDTAGGIFSGLPGIKGSAVIIFMLRWFLSKTLVKEGILEMYDRFIITRSDYYYLCPFNIRHLDLENFVWIPSSEGYGGYTDRFLVVGKNNILKALDILPPILKMNSSNIKTIAASGEFRNPESLIKFRWDYEGLKVRFFPLVMFTCSTASDKTRWKRRSIALYPEGVYLKYPEEYFTARESCMPPLPTSVKFCPSCLIGNSTTKTCTDIASQIYGVTYMHQGVEANTVAMAIFHTQLFYPSECISSGTLNFSNAGKTFCPNCTNKPDSTCFFELMKTVRLRKKTLEEALRVFSRKRKQRRNCFN
jgi:hypothetical protein